MAVPQLAAGIASGICMWVPQLTIVTVDVGTLGVGSGQMPWIVAPPLLIGFMIAGYASGAQLGTMAALEATGLANGLVAGFATGILKTTHAGVGVGTGVARIVGPPAFPSLVAGFSSAGITGLGSVSKAQGISTALQMLLGAYFITIPIVGASSPTGGSGAGTGKIL